MSELNTRIILRNDTLENWNANSDIVLKFGEVAFVALPDMSTGEANYDNVTFLTKVGDNKHTFAELKWLSANAADVYSWAKQQELPVNIQNSGDVVTEIRWSPENGGLEVIKDGKILVNTTDKENSNYIPQGTITLPSLNINQNIVSQEVDVVSDIGSPIEFSNSGSVTKKEDSKNSFNTNAMRAQVGKTFKEEYNNNGVDDETLVLFQASTEEAISKVGEINYTPPILKGSIPTFEKRTIVTSIEQPVVSYSKNKVDLEGVPVKISIGK